MFILDTDHLVLIQQQIMDLRIAATAMASDYTVLTRNLVDFQKVPGLRVADWTSAR